MAGWFTGQKKKDTGVPDQRRVTLHYSTAPFFLGARFIVQIDSLGIRVRAGSGSRGRHSDFNSVRLVANIVYSRLNVLIDLLCRVNKCLFDVSGSFGGGFEENEPVILSKLFALFVTDLTSVVEIDFVANEHHYHRLIGVLARLLQPSRQVVKRFAACDVIDKQRTGSAAIVRTGNRAERFLPRRIPYLQFDLTLVDGDHARQIQRQW